MRIAALDDEPCQLELIRHTMVTIGHECHGFAQGPALLQALCQQSYDMVILDWNLPRLEGPLALRRIRAERGSRLPILCMSDHCEEEDLVKALTWGADDFMVRPIRIGELQARVHALLRRSYPTQDGDELVVGAFRFLLPSRVLLVRGETAELSHREYDLALFLFRNIGRLLSREHLLEAVWDASLEASSRSLDTHMSRLRTKLDLRPANGLLLSAVYRLGYRLEVIGDGPTAPAAATAGTIEA